jgi:protoporphyrinogen oxidase
MNGKSPDSPANEKPTAVVLGAGFLGLKIAYDLLKKGIDVTVVEAAFQVGGLCASFTVDGLTFDLGPHFFYTGHGESETAIEAEYRLLLGGELTSLENTLSRSMLLSRQGLYTYQPLRFGHILRTFGARYVLTAGLEILGRRIVRKTRNCRSAKDLIESRMGRTIWEDMFASYIRKTSGMDPEQVDPLWVFDRETVLGKGGLFHLIVLNIRRSRRSRSGHCYPNSGGAHAIPLSYEKAVRAAGGNIVLNSSVKIIHVKDGVVEGITLLRNGARHLMTGDIYISTLPLPDMVQMLDPSPRAEVLNSARSLRFRGLALVCFRYPKEIFFDAPQVYVGSDGIPFKRLSEPKRICSAMGQPGVTGLCLEVCCQSEDPMWNKEDWELYALCREGVAKMGLEVNTNQLEGVAVKRIPHAYPVYPIGFAGHRARVLDAIGQIPNLLSKGRQGEFRHNIYTHQTFQCGVRTAEEVAVLLREKQKSGAR